MFLDPTIPFEVKNLAIDFSNVNTPTTTTTTTIEELPSLLEGQLSELLAHESSTSFLKNLLNLIELYPFQAAQILENPEISKALNSLDFSREFKDSFLKEEIACLIHFIEANINLLAISSIQKFISIQCVRIVTLLSLNSMLKAKSNDFMELTIANKIKNLIISPSTPSAIKFPLINLNAIFNELPHLSLSPFTQKGGINETHIENQIKSFQGQKFSSYTNAAKYAAIDAAYEVEGSFRDRGIRDWIHHQPGGLFRGEELVARYLPEFQSGRRSFIFTQCSIVPYQNYKEVMLYIIRALKEDREAYYKKFPNYINEQLYQNALLKFEEKKNTSKKENERSILGMIGKLIGVGGDEDERYIFEVIARKLIAMEEEVSNAIEEGEVFNCMSRFKSLYDHIKNFNMELTLATGIHPDVFFTYFPYKPILVLGIPPQLKKLAGHLSITHDHSFQEIFDHFSQFFQKVTYHSPHLPETIDEMERIYHELKNVSEQKELAHKFIKGWEIISKPALVKSDKVSSTAMRFNEYVDAIKDELGISKRDLDNLIKHPFGKPLYTESISFNLNDYPAVFNALEYDPEKSYQELIKLKAEIDQILQEGESTDPTLPTFSNKINSYLKIKENRKKQTFNLNFHYIKIIALQVLQEPFFEATLKIENLRSSLLSDPKSPDYLSKLFESLFELKKFIKKEVLTIPTLSTIGRQHATLSLNMIERIEEAIAQEIFRSQTTDIALLKKVAKELGYDFEFESRDIWHQESKQRLLGFAYVRRLILNSPGIMEKLESEKMTIDSAIQAIMGQLNSGFTATLDHFHFRQTDEQLLAGFATQKANLIGTLRFVEADGDFEAAKPGEILAIKYAMPEVHKYAAAKAILAEQGGLFSHGAITFSHLGIPALLGCPIENFKSLNNKLVHIQFGESKHTVEEIPEETANMLKEIELGTKESAMQIEKLPKEIAEIVYIEVYRALFNQFEGQEKLPQDLSYVKKYILHLKEEILQIKQSLWEAKDSIERRHIEVKLMKRYKHLRKIAEKAPDLISLTQLEGEILETQQQLANLDINRAGFGKSGKLENLDRLQELLPLIKSTVQLDVPAYARFNAESLVWSQYPTIKDKILAILAEEISTKEKSQKIHSLILEISLPPQNLLESIKIDGDLILRSSSKLEDQKNNAAAGIFDSIKLTNREEISTVFLHVLASAFSEKALTMFKDKVHSLFEMNVIVQSYVSKGTFSGVTFSVANEKEWQTAGIQLVKGLGGGVDGTENPTHAFIDTKDQTFVDLQIPEGEVSPCSTAMIKELASIIKQLERLCNAAVEIEFVGQEDKISIVQLRPITFSK